MRRRSGQASTISSRCAPAAPLPMYGFGLFVPGVASFNESRRGAVRATESSVFDRGCWDCDRPSAPPLISFSRRLQTSWVLLLRDLAMARWPTIYAVVVFVLSVISCRGAPLWETPLPCIKAADNQTCSSVFLEAATGASACRCRVTWRSTTPQTYQMSTPSRRRWASARVQCARNRRTLSGASVRPLS